MGDRWVPGASAAPHGEAATAVPLSRVRRVTAERMARSARSIAHVTLHRDVGISAIDRRRATAAALFDGRVVKMPWDAVFARAAGISLAEHPALLGEWVEGEGIRPRTAVDIGIAVAIGPDGSEGLLVPVLRDCARRPVGELASDLLGLVARAQTRRLPLADQDGGTFTITNLGMFGVDGFTPLVLPGQTAVLGIGRITDRVVVRGGEGVVRKVCTLSLSFDHRVVDGAPAGAFLARLAEILESESDPSELWDGPITEATAGSGGWERD